MYQQIKSHKICLVICILGTLILIGAFGYYLWMQSLLPSPVFTYEFMLDTSELVRRKMSIKQVEGLEYSIEPMGEIILSEPSPDWGIMIYFTEDHRSYLYFYGSYSPGGIDPFIYGTEDLNHDEINGKDMAWGIFGDRVIGSYKLSGSYGIVFDLEGSLWNDRKKLICDMIESAHIDTLQESF